MDEDALRKVIQSKYEALRSGMNEAVRRRWAAAEAIAIGSKGVQLVAQATGLSLPTIRRGMTELKQGIPLEVYRARRPGGGRKKATARDATLLADLEALVDPVTRGDCRATAKLTPWRH